MPEASHVSSGVTYKIQIQKQSFVVIDNATADVVAQAQELIRRGETAGIVPETLLNPHAIFMDMDATVIAEESLVEIAKAAGKETEVAALTAKAMAGGMDFAESLRIRLAMLKGTPRSIVQSVVPHLNPGMRDFAEAMTKRKVNLFLVSGGFMDLAEPVAKDLGFRGVRANRFAWDGDNLAGDVDGEIVGAAGKRDAMLGWCKTYGFDPKCCIAVGDGANDLMMMESSGLAVGFQPKKALWSKVSVCNAVGDHRLLAELLKLHELAHKVD